MDVSNATNILDRWIAADTRRLTAFVRVEMDAYRLYTVVPDLVRFIENLTNIYVRYNRTRLKGRLGVEDCKFALASLFDVLLTVCKVSGQSPSDAYAQAGATGIIFLASTAVLLPLLMRGVMKAKHVLSL